AQLAGTLERFAGDTCFFFQAEDGIRDGHVTGVQTCALPICESRREEREGRNAVQEARTGHRRNRAPSEARRVEESARRADQASRSEERRVGKEGRTRGWTDCRKDKGERRQQTGKE